MIRYNTQERIKVSLFSGTTPVTGLVPTDFKGSRVQICKADGTTSFVNLVLNTNLKEVDSTNSPGLYEIVLSTSDTNQVGPLSISLVPSTNAFDTKYVSEFVEPVLTVSQFTAVNNVSKYLLNKSVIDQNGRLIVYESDGTTIAYQFYLKDLQQKPSVFSIYSKEPV